MNLRWTILCATACLGAGVAPTDDARRLDRRSGAEPLLVFEPVSTVDGLRVLLRSDGVERTDIVPWDRISRLQAPRGEALERRISDGIELGTLVWRGRERLRRGDVVMAAEAFDEASAQLDVAGLLGGLFDRAVMEGRLRAEIGLGRSMRVLGEAMVVGNLAEQPGSRFEGAAFGPTVIDADTGLVPGVPPVGDDVAVAACETLFEARPAGDADDQRRRDLWLRILQRDGVAVEGRRPDREDEGAVMLWNLARLDDPDADVRGAARRALLEVKGTTPDWIVLWSRFFAGRASITHAAGDEDLLRGILDLMYIVAREGAAPPILRAESIRLLVDTLRILDRDAEASIFESISQRRPNGRRLSEPSS